jgi:hypothetical protein
MFTIIQNSKADIIEQYHMLDYLKLSIAGDDKALKKLVESTLSGYRYVCPTSAAKDAFITNPLRDAGIVWTEAGSTKMFIDLPEPPFVSANNPIILQKYLSMFYKIVQNRMHLLVTPTVSILGNPQNLLEVIKNAIDWKCHVEIMFKPWVWSTTR